MLKKILAIFLLLSIGTGVSSAVSMQVSPDYIDPGGTIQITYSDLLDGSSFSLLIKEKLDVNPNSDYTMNINSLVIPINLSDGIISANADNSLKLALSYEGSDGTIKTILKYGDSNNICRISESQSISAKTYEKMRIEGVASEGNIVNTEFNFIGTKSGPNSGTISMVISGMDHSTITIICSVDGTIITNTPVYIGGGSAISPTAVPTTAVPTTSAGSSSGGSSSSGSSSGSSDYVASSETVVNDTPTDTPVSQPEPSVGVAKTACSVDEACIYTGEGASGVIIMYDSVASLPSGWNCEGKAYALFSDGTGIAGTISICIPESLISAGENGNLFIGESVNDQWMMLPSTVSGDVVVSPISEEGTYALMSLKETTSGGAAAEPTETNSAGVSPIIGIIIIGLAMVITVKLRK